MNNTDMWRPGLTIQTLKLRAQLLKKTRAFFDRLSYCEVQTPVLSRDTTIDRWLEPPKVEQLYANAPTLFLQTSPEFAMKRLLAIGAPSIYQICPAFRAGECGQRHNPEFTIVEWYGVGEDYERGMQLLGELCADLLGTPPAQKIEYRDAFLKFAQLDPFAASMEQIRAYCRQENVGIPEGFDPLDRDSWLDVILTEKVQPKLGADRPTVLHHYPASQSALAQIVQTSYGLAAERFELFVRGYELANGYHELADGKELRRRHETTNRQRIADGHAPLPPDSILIQALQEGRFPPCTGCAMGFDRVVMLAANVTDIDEAISFSFQRA